MVIFLNCIIRRPPSNKRRNITIVSPLPANPCLTTPPLRRQIPIFLYKKESPPTGEDSFPIKYKLPCVNKSLVLQLPLLLPQLIYH